MSKKKTDPAEPEISREKQLWLTLHHINTVLNAETPKSEWKEYVHLAKDRMTPFILRRPTRIIDLDIATGGGFPAGGPIQIAAPDGVGKNALCLQVIATNQAIYGEDSAVAWCCTELAFDKPFAHRFDVAVPMSDMEIALEEQARKERGFPPFTQLEIENRKRQVGTFVVIDYGSTAKRLEAVVELVKSNMFQIIVIDSVAAILTDKREDTPLDEFAQQSSEAFLLTEFQKKLWGAYTPSASGVPNYTTLIEINQARAKRNLKGPFDRKWEVGGAYALKHAKLGDILLTRGEQIKASVADASDPDDLNPKKKSTIIGKNVKWEIAKGKAGFHEGPKGVIEYHFDTGFQLEKSLVNTAINYGVIVQTKKGWYGLIEDTGEVVEEVRGKNTLYSRAYDGEWFNKVYAMVLRKAEVVCLYKL